MTLQRAAFGSPQATSGNSSGHSLCPPTRLAGTSRYLPAQRSHAEKRFRQTETSAAPRPAICVTSVAEDGFDQAVLKEKGKYVLVDFWATWCGPCKLIDPFMKQLEEEFPDKLKVVKVEADPNPNLVEKYKVYGLPTLILFKDGSMIKGSLNEGAITKPALIKYLEKYGIAKEVAK